MRKKAAGRFSTCDSPFILFVQRFPYVQFRHGPDMTRFTFSPRYDTLLFWRVSTVHAKRKKISKGDLLWQYVIFLKEQQRHYLLLQW